MMCTADLSGQGISEDLLLKMVFCKGSLEMYPQYVWFINKSMIGLGNLDPFGLGFLGLLKHFEVFLAGEGCWQL